MCHIEKHHLAGRAVDITREPVSSFHMGFDSMCNHPVDLLELLLFREATGLFWVDASIDVSRTYERVRSRRNWVRAGLLAQACLHMNELMCLVHETTPTAQETRYTTESEALPVARMLDVLVELGNWHGGIKTVPAHGTSECRVGFAVTSNLCGSDVLKVVIGWVLVVDGAFQERVVECRVLGRGLSAEGGMWVVVGIGRVGGVGGIDVVSGVIALILFRIIFNIAAVIFDIAAVLIQLRVAWFRRSNERYELVTRKEPVQYVRSDVYYRTLC